MNIILKNLSSLHSRNISFNEPVKNAIISDSRFIRIQYVDPNVTLMGLLYEVPIKEISNCSNVYKKCIITYNVHNRENIKTFDEFKQIESIILHKYQSNQSNIEFKNPIFNLRSHLDSGIIKIYSDADNIYNKPTSNNDTFVLKISGIWENDSEFGLTFKIL